MGKKNVKWLFESNHQLNRLVKHSKRFWTHSFCWICSYHNISTYPLYGLQVINLSGGGGGGGRGVSFWWWRPEKKRANILNRTNLFPATSIKQKIPAFKGLISNPFFVYQRNPCQSMYLPSFFFFMLFFGLL